MSLKTLSLTGRSIVGAFTVELLSHSIYVSVYMISTYYVSTYNTTPGSRTGSRAGGIRKLRRDLSLDSIDNKLFLTFLYLKSSKRHGQLLLFVPTASISYLSPSFVVIIIVPFAFFLNALLRRQSSSPYPLRGRAIDALVLFICRACEILYKEVKCKLRVLYLYRNIWSLGLLKMLYTLQLPVVKCITKSTYVGNFVFIPCTTLFDHVFPHTT